MDSGQRDSNAMAERTVNLAEWVIARHVEKHTPVPACDTNAASSEINQSAIGATSL